MDRVVQFMSTIDSFNNAEFELFCQKLYEIYDRKEIIMKSLFFLTLHEFEHNKYDHINTINKINADILDLRKYQKLEAKEIEPTNTFQLIPPPIISHITTFLQTSELFIFMKCNRYIYISCMSIPTTIQEFNRINPFLNNRVETSSMRQKSRICQFRMVKRVSLESNDFNESNFGLNGCEWIWKKLDVLSVSDLKFLPGKINYFSKASPESPEEIMIHILKRIQLKHLSLHSISFKNPEMLTNILSANKKLEYLSIDSINGVAISDDVKAIFKSIDLKTIKALALFRCTNIGDQLLCAVSNQLQSLHIQAYNQMTYQRHEYNFLESSGRDYTKLQELCISDIRPVTLFHILKSAMDIRRIHFCVPIREEEAKVLKHMIEQLIHLEYLSLEPINEWDWIIKPLKNAFKRKNMKIRMKYTDDYSHGSQGYFYPRYRWNLLGFLEIIENKLMELVTVLHQSVSNDFLFECIFEFSFGSVDTHMKMEDDCFTGVKNKLEQLKKKYDVKIKMNKTMVEGFVISNKNNSMHGYRERWLYSCKKCYNPIDKYSSLNPDTSFTIDWQNENT